MICKALAFGIVMHPRAYLRRGWTLFEFSMVILSLLQFIPVFPKLSITRLARLIPAIQAMSRIPGTWFFGNGIYSL